MIMTSHYLACHVVAAAADAAAACVVVVAAADDDDDGGEVVGVGVGGLEWPRQGCRSRFIRVAGAGAGVVCET